MKIKIVETINESRVTYWEFSISLNIMGPPHLCVPRPYDRPALFAVLHELGHIQHVTMGRMRRHTGPRSREQWLLNRKVLEIRAWQYAASCVKPAYRKELARFSKQYFNTHFPCTQKDIDKWLLKDNKYLRRW